MSIGSSSFVILYHRTPFDESIDSEGNRTWVDQKSPNGIIPTLRNLFRNKEDGTWIAWRRVDSVDNAEDESIEITSLPRNVFGQYFIPFQRILMLTMRIGESLRKLIVVLLKPLAKKLLREQLFGFTITTSGSYLDI
jgi:hypothetical protein